MTGSHAPKELTPELIKRILAAYGEHSLANNDELISEMLDGATGKACIFDPAKSDQSKEDKEAGHKPMLDVKTFAEALTYDIKLYDIRNEVRDSTNLDDIFVTDETIEQKEQEMFLASNQAELDKAFDEGQGLRDRFAVSTKLERKNTLPAIDLTAETYRSKGLIVALWATILITYFAYFFRYDREIERVCGDEYTYEFDSPWGANQSSMICEALVSIFVWLYFFSFMSVFGIVCVYIGSIGNEVDCREPWKPITGSCAILLLVTISYGVLKDKEVNENAILYIASLVLGLICCGFHLSRAVTMLVEPGKLEDLQSCLPVRIQSLFSSSVSAEANIKQAAARKLNALTVNALKVVKTTDQDNVLGTHYGQALRNYSSGPKQFQTAGGFFWTWRR